MDVTSNRTVISTIVGPAGVDTGGVITTGLRGNRRICISSCMTISSRTVGSMIVIGPRDGARAPGRCVTHSFIVGGSGGRADGFVRAVYKVGLSMRRSFQVACGGAFGLTRCISLCDTGGSTCLSGLGFGGVDCGCRLPRDCLNDSGAAGRR